MLEKANKQAPDVRHNARGRDGVVSGWRSLIRRSLPVVGPTRCTFTTSDITVWRSDEPDPAPDLRVYASSGSEAGNNRIQHLDTVVPRRLFRSMHGNYGVRLVS